MKDFVANRKFLIVLFFFIVSAYGQIFSQSLSVGELLDRTEATLKWEPYSRVGLLEKDNKSISFGLDRSWMIYNYSIRIPTGAVLKDKGILIFSEEAARTVLGLFGEEVDAEKSYNVGVILIDPGHGGKDPGTASTVNVNGVPVYVQEKNIVLDVSLRLAEILKEKYPDKQIMLTRNDDSYPTLEERVEMANNIEVGPKEGIIFIAVHVNAALNPLAEGYEVWHLPETYRRQVLNSSDYEGEKSVLPVINSILEEQYSMESVRLAQNILDNLREELPETVPDRGLREESWYVVRNARMAAVLVELGYITNKDESLRMMQTNYLKKLTNGLYNGINDFIDYFEEKGFSR